VNAPLRLINKQLVTPVSERARSVIIGECLFFVTATAHDRAGDVTDVDTKLIAFVCYRPHECAST
jgi:hypothetical protein